MTFVGKVLVVVQVVLSLFFMAFAGAVFTIQTNWKTAFEKQISDLEVLRKDAESQQAKFDKLKDDVKKVVFGEQANLTDLDDLLNWENDILTEAKGRSLVEYLAIVKSERDAATQSLATMTTERDNLVAQNERLLAEKRILIDEANARRGEANKARVVIAALHKKQDTLVSNLKIKDDQLLAQERKIGQLDLMVKAAQEQIIDLNLMKERLFAVLEKENIDPDQALTADALPPAPDVGGLVLAARRVKTSQFVEISIGSDDGLVKGHKLYVFRTAENNGGRPKYLGRIQLMHVTPDRSVGSIVEPAKNGIISREDHVTTKF